MPTIEERAHEKLNEVWKERGLKLCHDGRSRKDSSLIEAICRTLETLDAERAAHALFRQEVSDAVGLLHNAAPGEERLGAQMRLNSFILPKPVDPLVEVLDTMLRRRTFEPAAEVVADEAAWLRAALAKRGLKLVEVGDAD